MKTTKSKKVKKKNTSSVRSSVKSSFDRLLNDDIFRGLLVLLLIGFIIYAPLVSLQYLLRGEIVVANTRELSSDVSIEKVSYVNENGKIFLDNGSSIERAEGYVVLLYGNDFWYSFDEGVLATPITLKQSIVNIMSYCLLSWSLFLIMYLLLWLIGYKKSVIHNKKIKSVLTISMYLIATVLLVCDMCCYMSIFKLLSNIPYTNLIGIVVAIIFELLKIKLLANLVDSVDKKHGLC